jgi:hypothetical protein
MRRAAYSDTPWRRFDATAAAAATTRAARPHPVERGGPALRAAGPDTAGASTRPPCRGLGGVRRQYVGLAHSGVPRTRAGLRELALRAGCLLPGHGSRLLVAGGATVAEPGGRAARGHRPLPGAGRPAEHGPLGLAGVRGTGALPVVYGQPSAVGDDEARRPGGRWSDHGGARFDRLSPASGLDRRPDAQPAGRLRGARWISPRGTGAQPQVSGNSASSVPIMPPLRRLSNGFVTIPRSSARRDGVSSSVEILSTAFRRLLFPRNTSGSARHPKSFIQSYIRYGVRIIPRLEQIVPFGGESLVATTSRD